MIVVAVVVAGCCALDSLRASSSSNVCGLPSRPMPARMGTSSISQNREATAGADVGRLVGEGKTGKTDMVMAMRLSC